jgi:AcrR family transcriptional regulator
VDLDDRAVTRRRRLAPDLRRNQLLDLGAHAFASRAYEDVRMADIAEHAGITRGLVYRYFATKRELFAAVYQRASQHLLESTVLASDRDIAGQVLHGLDAHFDFFEANTRLVLVANRGALAGDPLIEGIVSDELRVIRQRMLDALSLSGHERSVASVALYGWLAFVRAVCVEWLADRTCSRDELRGVCLRTLASALGTSLDTR